MQKVVWCFSGQTWGYREKTGVSIYGLDGSVPGIDYGSNGAAGISLMYGSMPGTINYRAPGAASDSTTQITESSLICLINACYRLDTGTPFLIPFAGLGLGGAINFDSLGSYPLGWKIYEDEPEWMIDPNTITAKRVSAAYLGIAARCMAGVQIAMSELFFLSADAGYLAYSRNRYDDPFKFGPAVSFADMEPAVNAGGLYLEASARFLF